MHLSLPFEAQSNYAMSSPSSPSATIDRKQAEDDASKSGTNCDKLSLPPSCNFSSVAPPVRNLSAPAVPFATSSPRDPCHYLNAFAVKNSRTMTPLPTPEEDENCVPTLFSHFSPLTLPQPSPQNPYSGAPALSPFLPSLLPGCNEKRLHPLSPQLPISVRQPLPAAPCDSKEPQQLQWYQPMASLPSGTSWTPFEPKILSQQPLSLLPPWDDPLLRQSIMVRTQTQIPLLVPSPLPIPSWTRTNAQNNHVRDDLWSSSLVGSEVFQDKEDEDKKSKEAEEDFAVWSEVQQQVELRTRRLRYENWKLQQTVWKLQQQAHRQEQEDERASRWPRTATVQVPGQQEFVVPPRPAGYRSFAASTPSMKTTSWLAPLPPQELVGSFSPQQEIQSQPPQPPDEWRSTTKDASQELEAATTRLLVEKVSKNVPQGDAVLAGNQQEEECSTSSETVIIIDTDTDSAANLATPDVSPKKRPTAMKKTLRPPPKKSSRVTTTEKTKKKKDLTRPKRPMTAYNFYFKQQRALMLANKKNKNRQSKQVLLSSPMSPDSPPHDAGGHRLIGSLVLRKWRGKSVNSGKPLIQSRWRNLNDSLCVTRNDIGERKKHG